jgi:phosphoribosylaminoimidazole-succinocarboxamide synthase
MTSPVVETHLEPWPCTRGKVRDVYDLGDRLLLISTDRISAFDWVLPTPIPDKGRVLTQVSNYWFAQLDLPHHLLVTDIEQMGLPPEADLESLAGRTVLVRKTQVVPIECVVRAYLSGSAWNEYRSTGRVAGVSLPTGLEESERLPAPLFTPATKAAQGEHDENITFADMQSRVGSDLAAQMRQRSLDVFAVGCRRAQEAGIIVADTKFEFGLIDGQLMLIDEVMTPDSSRFWPMDGYRAGGPQPSFDKQFVRDWLSATPWDKNSPPPELPPDVVAQTRAKYIEACERITGEPFAWT